MILPEIPIFLPVRASRVLSFASGDEASMNPLKGFFLDPVFTPRRFPSGSTAWNSRERFGSREFQACD